MSCINLPGSASSLLTPNAPSIRRLPQHLLRLVGMKRKVVRKYIAASTDLLPAIADVGVEPLETVTDATEHASEEEEESDS